MQCLALFVLVGQIGINWEYGLVDTLKVALGNDHVSLDMIEGSGFYYRNILSDGSLLYETALNMPEPTYFLSKCRKRNTEVPYYVSKEDKIFDSIPSRFKD